MIAQEPVVKTRELKSTVDSALCLRSAITRALKRQGYGIEFHGGELVAFSGRFVRRIDLDNQLATMITDGRSVGQQAALCAERIGVQFILDGYAYCRLKAAFPGWRVLVRDQYLIIQRRPGERGLAKSYWSLPASRGAYPGAMSTWIREAGIIFASLPPDELAPSAPDFAVSVGDFLDAAELELLANSIPERDKPTNGRGITQPEAFILMSVED